MDIRRLYNDEIEIHFDEENHKYFLNGEKEIDGCTTILRIIAAPDLEDWKRRKILESIRIKLKEPGSYDQARLDRIFEDAVNVPDSIKITAGISGTATHKNIESIFRTGKEASDTPEESLVETKLFFETLGDLGLTMIESERFIYSKEHNFCGTLDFLARNKDGRLVLGDIKTGRMLPKHFFQTAAYQGAYQEEIGEDIAERIIITVSPKGTKVYKSTDFQEDYICFIAALTLTRRLRELKWKK